MAGLVYCPKDLLFFDMQFLYCYIGFKSSIIFSFFWKIYTFSRYFFIKFYIFLFYFQLCVVGFFPAGTQRLEDHPSGPILVEISQTIIGHNRTYYVFNLFWLRNVWSTLGIRKYKKISLKTYFMDND